MLRNISLATLSNQFHWFLYIKAIVATNSPLNSILKDLNSVNISQNLTARPKLRFEFWQNSSKSSNESKSCTLNLRKNMTLFLRPELDFGKGCVQLICLTLESWNITGPINVRESEIHWFDWSVKKLGSKVGPDSVFLLTWCPSAAPLAAKWSLMYYLLDAVGSWQIILPMPNLERAY